MAENGGDFSSGQHAAASRQFTEARAITLLPAQDAADCPPVSQTGVVEKMAKEQLPIGHRTGVKAIGAGDHGRTEG